MLPLLHTIVAHVVCYSDFQHVVSNQ
uniref:Uncharacterized protein n=1 Tax=Arundo donax TaxID=35708 RepID=A0A0A8Y288_ARUDO